MATSGQKTVTVTGNHTLIFDWWMISQSVPSNTTTIGWKMHVQADSYGGISYTAKNAWSVTVNGSQYSGTVNWGTSKNEDKELAYGQTTITHAADGSKTFSYSFSMAFNFTWGGTYRGTYSGNSTGTLPSIARASTLSAEDGTLGERITLTVGGTSGLTYKVEYTCGSASGTVTGGTTSTSIPWTIPMELAEQNTTGTTVSINFKLTTYSSGTEIGTATAKATGTIPETIMPTVSFTVQDETGAANTYGYLQSLSQLRIAVTAAGTRGSFIRQNTVTVDGKSYAGEDVLTQAITTSGQLDITVKTLDSRGRTATAATTITVNEYELPKISKTTIYRSDAAGNPTSAGEYMTIEFCAEIYPLNNANTAKYSVQYKKTTDTGYSETVLTSIGGQYWVDGAKFVFVAEKAASYDIVVVAADAFRAIKKAGVGAAVGKLWSVFKKGLGFAFGKVAKLAGTLDIAFVTRLEGGLLYPVLPSSTNMDDVMLPNWYACGDAAGNGYINCPVTDGTFLLEVQSVGDEGQLKQRITSCDTQMPKTVERFYSSGTWGTWLHVNAGETVLYDNELGSNGGITLAQSLDQFQYVDVFYTDNNGKAGGFSRMYKPDGKRMCIAIIESSTGAYLRHTIYDATGNTMTPDMSKSGYIYLTNATPSRYNGNYIKIIRVIGHA